MSPYSRETPKIAIPMYAAYTSISIQEHSCSQNWDIHIHFAQLPPTVSNFVSSEVQSKERGNKGGDVISPKKKTQKTHFGLYKRMMMKASAD